MPSSTLLIVTTVPETFATILKHQPAFLANALSGSLKVELVTSPGPEMSDVVKTEGTPVHKIRMVRGISPLRDMLAIIAMMRLITQIKPAIVHSYTPKAGLVAMLAAWACRVPIRVHTFTGLIFPTKTGLKQNLLVWIDRLICACATHLVPEGVGVKKDLQAHRITRKPLNVIGHGNIAGVDTTYFSNDAEGVTERVALLAQELNSNIDDFIFCYVGRLNKDKGITELLDAFLDLPVNARLLLVGKLDDTAPISDESLNLIRRHARIHPLGFLSDIRPALSLANVLVLPSYREGFPNAVLQAGAMRRPAIVTDVSGSNEIIEPAFNGWIIPVRSAEHLRSAMQEAMLAPPHVISSMGENARERVVLRYERQPHLERMADFYKRFEWTPPIHTTKQRSGV